MFNSDMATENVDAALPSLNCCVCFEFIQGEILVCPRDGKTQLCRTCINRINERCPMCKATLRKDEYVRVRSLEELRMKF